MWEHATGLLADIPASKFTSGSRPNVVWEHATGLLADPAMIRAEIDRRLTQARVSDRSPASARRSS